MATTAGLAKAALGAAGVADAAVGAEAAIAEAACFFPKAFKALAAFWGLSPAAISSWMPCKISRPDFCNAEAAADFSAAVVAEAAAAGLSEPPVMGAVDMAVFSLKL